MTDRDRENALHPLQSNSGLTSCGLAGDINKPAFGGRFFMADLWGSVR